MFNYFQSNGITKKNKGFEYILLRNIDLSMLVKETRNKVKFVQNTIWQINILLYVNEKCLSKIRGKTQLMLAQYKSLNVKTRQSRKHISSYNCRSHLGLDIWWLNLHNYDMWFRLHPFEMNFNRFYTSDSFVILKFDAF